MDRIDKFAQDVQKVDYYISNPLSFLYEHIENPTTAEIIECYKFILMKNQEMLNVHQEYLNHLDDFIKDVKPLSVEVKMESLVEESVAVSSEKKEKDISDVIDYVTYCNIDTELDTFLATLTREDIVRLKLYFLREVNLHQAVIKETIFENPYADIKELQSELKVYKDILEHLKQYVKKVLDANEEKENVNLSNIILLPISKSSYLLEDICAYPERSKEIKNAFDKIVEGYFLQTKDLKAIEGTKESLYEYRNPNGLRILYFVKNNLILVASLFFKDKQKSTKISGYYEEAQNRYYNAYEYIRQNISNPDFYVEQAELIGQIYSFLENNIVVSKRLGDQNE